MTRLYTLSGSTLHHAWDSIVIAVDVAMSLSTRKQPRS